MRGWSAVRKSESQCNAHTKAQQLLEAVIARRNSVLDQ